jgi:hypothetical protein
MPSSRTVVLALLIAGMIHACHDDLLIKRHHMTEARP